MSSACDSNQNQTKLLSRMSVLGMRLALEVLQVQKARLVLIALAAAGALLLQSSNAGALRQNEHSAAASRQDGDDDSKAADDAADDDDAGDDARASDLLPVRAVVLVDESGSLEVEDVQAERDAVTFFADTIEPGWEVAILPFGSDNGIPGQRAVNNDCKLIKVESEANRQRLRDCAQTIHRRDEIEGNDTDHAAALNEAVATLTSAEGDALPVIFLMTDGVLDVDNSIGLYGENPTDEARKRIEDEILPKAKKNNIQVWPVGFGEADKAALEILARGGAQNNVRCPNTAASPPQPVVEPNPEEFVRSFQQIAASAGCLDYNDESFSLADGESKESTFKISPLATSGTLSVVKSNAKSTVTFIDPQGVEVTEDGEDGPSAYERDGEGTRSEVLRIDRPKPGDWKVNVSAEDGGQTFIVSARWAGKVDMSINVPTGNPAPGKTSTMTLRLKTAYPDQKVPPEAVEGFDFSGELSGEGFKPVKFKLVDDGEGVDETAGDLRFSGTFTTPEGCDGPAELRGSVSAHGLAGDDRSLSIDCSAPEPTVVADIALDGVPEGGLVTLGTELTGRVSLDNQGEAFVGKLSIVDASPGAQLSIDPSSVQVPAGTSEVEFSVIIADGSKPGQTTFSIRLTGNASPVATSDQRLVTEEKPPIWPLIIKITIMVLLIAGVAAVLVRRRRQAQVKLLFVKGLQAILVEDGNSTPAVRAEVGKKLVFPVKVSDFGMRSASETDQDAYLVRRDRRSPKTKVIVRRPGGDEFEVAIGQAFDLDGQTDDGDPSNSGGSNRRLKIVEKS